MAQKRKETNTKKEKKRKDVLTKKKKKSALCGEKEKKKVVVWGVAKREWEARGFLRLDAGREGRSKEHREKRAAEEKALGKTGKKGS